MNRAKKNQIGIKECKITNKVNWKNPMPVVKSDDNNVKDYDARALW